MRQRANVRHRAKFRGDRSNRCWDMAAAILDFQNMEILGVGTVKTAKVHH